MTCNVTYEATPFRNRLARRTYSSIRCSRQTQRTQLEITGNRSLSEQHEQQQYMHQGCHTISEECTSTGQSFMSQNNEQCDAGDTGSRIFLRGPIQLRDSRRKTAEQWQTRKHSLTSDGNSVEEIRCGQKVKFSPAIDDRSFLRNLRNTVQNKGSHQNSTLKQPDFTLAHLLPSLFSSSMTGLKSKSRNFESNSGSVCHSDSSYPANSCTRPKELHLKSAGLYEIRVNIPKQNQNPLNKS
ncbi:hypothetical protein LOAG_07912, partial [Loa loa]